MGFLGNTPKMAILGAMAKHLPHTFYVGGTLEETPIYLLIFFYLSYIILSISVNFISL